MTAGDHHDPLYHAPPSPDVLRILDANANRASEGLRVVEEYARFVLDDRHLTSLCKHLRHELGTCVQFFPSVALLAARDTARDVGTSVKTETEFQRESLQSVVHANFQRTAQALRCLEEFTKVWGEPEAAAGFESLRYRLYSLQRALILTRDSRARLAHARLYVLVSGGSSETEFRRLATTLIEAGVQVLQLRDKQLNDRTLLARARLLRELTLESGTLFIINDRPDLAVLARADGVHVGQDELPIREVRAIAGTSVLVGVSTHSLEQARQAVLDGANYLGCGPTFPSRTKEFAEFPGTPFLQAVAAEITLPAFAIGGIGPDNVAHVLASGFGRVAVGQAITGAPNPAAVTAQVLQALQTQPAERTASSPPAAECH